MKNNTDSLPYSYFTATFLGWNGSNSRIIATVSGCWDSETQAQDALDAKCDKVREAWCDANGRSYDDATVDDRSSGWLGDYQRTSVEFSVTPSVDEKIDHSKTETLQAGEVPTFA